MASRRRVETKGTEQPGDDLTRISGVGPVVAGRLAAAGVHTYRELAERTPEQLAAILVGLPACSPRRIASGDWIGQARAFADVPTAGQGTPEVTAQDEPTSVEGRQKHTSRPAASAFLRVLRLGVTGTGSSDCPLGAGESATIALELRPGSGTPPAAVLGYTATVTGRRLEDDARVVVAEFRGVVEVARGISHAAAGPATEPGVYQLEAVVDAFLLGHDLAESPVWTETVSGEQLHVVVTHAERGDVRSLRAAAAL
jgi:hypothetical protein